MPLQTAISEGTPGHIPDSIALNTFFNAWEGYVPTTFQRAAYARPAINVRDALWGAKGDGVTDDTAALGAALAFSTSFGGGDVYVPGGTYKTSADLALPAGAHLVGASRQTTTINDSRTSGSTIKAVGTTGAHLAGINVEEITISGGSAGTNTRRGLQFDFCDRVTLKNVTVIQTAYALKCHAVTQLVTDGCLWQDCSTSDGTNKAAVHLDADTTDGACSAITFANTVWRNCRERDLEMTGSTTRVQNVRVQNCRFEADTNMKGDRVVLTTTRDILFFGNSWLLGAFFAAYTTKDYGLVATDCDGLHILGNAFEAKNQVTVTVQGFIALAGSTANTAVNIGDNAFYAGNVGGSNANTPATAAIVYSGTNNLVAERANRYAAGTGTLISGSPTSTQSTTGVTAGTYGSATQSAQIVIDADGRITSASNVAITGASGSSAHVLQENGSDLTARAKLNFRNGLLATDGGAGPDSTIVDAEFANPGTLNTDGSVANGVATTAMRSDAKVGIPALLNANARLKFTESGVTKGTERTLDLIAGTNINFGWSDDTALDILHLTLSAAGGGGGGASILNDLLDVVVAGDATSQTLRKRSSDGQYVNTEDFINVLSFGAIRGGTANSTTAAANKIALQAALDAGAGKCVFFPAGQYYTNGPLLVSSGTRVMGAVRGGNTPSTATGTAYGATVILAASQNVAVFAMKTTTTCATVFDSMGVDGNAGNQTDNTLTHGIHFNTTTPGGALDFGDPDARHRVYNSWVTNCRAWGINAVGDPGGNQKNRGGIILNTTVTQCGSGFAAGNINIQDASDWGVFCNKSTGAGGNPGPADGIYRAPCVGIRAAGGNTMVALNKVGFTSGAAYSVESSRCQLTANVAQDCYGEGLICTTADVYVQGFYADTVGTEDASGSGHAYACNVQGTRGTYLGVVGTARAGGRTHCKMVAVVNWSGASETYFEGRIGQATGNPAGGTIAFQSGTPPASSISNNLLAAAGPGQTFAKYKTADTDVTSTTITAWPDPDLVISGLSTGKYAIEAWILFDAHTDNDFKCQFAQTVGTGTINVAAIDRLSALLDDSDTQVDLNPGGAATAFRVAGGRTNTTPDDTETGERFKRTVAFNGFLDVTSGTGTVEMRWGQLVADATKVTRVHRGSWLKLTQLA